MTNIKFKKKTTPLDIGYWKFVIGYSRSAGFSLIELVVDLAILAILAAIIVVLINPAEQFKKARDGQRHSDLKSLQQVFDTYYHDTNCYPTSSAIPWGQEWSQNASIYIKRVPTGPSSSSYCQSSTCSEYTYVTSSGTGPQWYALFSDKEVIGSASIPDKSLTCPLESRNNCVPQNYVPGDYLCVYGGVINCDTVSSAVLPVPVINNPVPSLTPIPTAMATPTPPVPTHIPTPASSPTPIHTLTPTPTIPTCNPTFACRGNPARCNIISTPQPGEIIYCNPSCNNVCQ